jgi:hypothetical protein
MLDRSLEAEFEGYRKILPTNEARRAFDERIERLLSQLGVDYVRGYVDALKDASSGGSGGEWLRASADARWWIKLCPAIRKVASHSGGGWERRLPPLKARPAFEIAAASLSFSAAAEELNPHARGGQPPALEDDLGVALFRRFNRRIELTAAGATLLPGVRQAKARCHALPIMVRGLLSASACR